MPAADDLVASKLEMDKQDVGITILSAQRRRFTSIIPGALMMEILDCQNTNLLQITIPVHWRVKWSVY